MLELFGSAETNMYKNKFVVAVKDSSGNVLRDTSNKIEIPFYEEYSILLKNENSSNAQVLVRVDGEEVDTFIVRAYSSLDLSRWVKGNLTSGRKFIFLPQNDVQLANKKDSGELGIIEVEVKYEKAYMTTITNFPYVTTPYTGNGYIGTGTGMIRFANLNSLNTPSFSNSVTCSNMKLGGTGEGSLSKQEFTQASIVMLEDNTTTFRLRLVPSSEAKTVNKTKHIYCISCGKKNPYEAKFCMQCGNKVTTNWQD